MVYEWTYLTRIHRIDMIYYCLVQIKLYISARNGGLKYSYTKTHLFSSAVFGIIANKKKKWI